MMLHDEILAFGGSDSFNDWRQVRPSHIQSVAATDTVTTTGRVAVGYNQNTISRQQTSPVVSDLSVVAFYTCNSVLALQHQQRVFSTLICTTHLSHHPKTLSHHATMHTFVNSGDIFLPTFWYTAFLLLSDLGMSKSMQILLSNTSVEMLVHYNRRGR